MYKYISLFFISISIHANAQRIAPGKAQSKPMAIIGATLHTGNGTVIENAALLFENGKITSIGDARVIRLNAETTDIVDASGKHIYPGLIACNTQLGLVDIEYLRPTRDFAESGDMNPNSRTAIAFNTDSKVLATVRSNGILLAQTAPTNGTISGQSSIMMMDGWNWEDAAYKLDDGIWLNWPRMFINTGWWAEPGETQKLKTEKMLDEIEALFAEAHAYANMPDAKLNLKLESMRGLFDGSKKLFVRCEYVKEIESAVAIAAKYRMNLVISGGSDAWMVAELLKKNNVQVMFDSTHDLPMREDDPVDMKYAMASRLKEAGVDFCINLKKAGDPTFWQVRSLAFLAGTASGYGLSKEEALSAITLSAARVLGIDKTTGSLEDGKDATFIICDGDIMDMKESNVSRAFIQGREVNMDNDQKELYRMYKEKYGF